MPIFGHHGPAMQAASEAELEPADVGYAELAKRLTEIGLPET